MDDSRWPAIGYKLPRGEIGVHDIKHRKRGRGGAVRVRIGSIRCRTCRLGDGRGQAAVRLFVPSAGCASAAVAAALR
jgi:hypothetical protein